MSRTALLVLACLALPLSAAARTAHAPLSGEAELLAAARAALPWPDAEVAVVRLSPTAADARPPLRVVWNDRAPRGRASAEVEVQHGGAWRSAGWAFFDVAVFDTVAVATQDLARGAPLGGAVALRRADVTALFGAPLAGDLGDWTARRTLRAGDVLTDRLAEPPSAAERGDAVHVRYRRGAVAVSLDCTARERGAVGEPIRVACSETRALYRVVLTAPGQGDWTATL